MSVISGWWVDILNILTAKGDDNSSGISLRSSLTIISSLNLIATVLDAVTSVKCTRLASRNELMVHVASLKSLLVTVFQIANVFLILAAIFESTTLIQLYVWYSLGYIVIRLMICIIEFVVKFKEIGSISFVEFIVDVIFLFVTFRCLPVVDLYRKHLDERNVSQYNSNLIEQEEVEL